MKLVNVSSDDSGMDTDSAGMDTDGTCKYTKLHSIPDISVVDISVVCILSHPHFDSMHTVTPTFPNMLKKKW